MKMRVYARALRVHQWAKNTLVFVAALAAGKVMQLHSVATLGLVFIAFSCVASAGYLINDLLDLESDRSHPTKRNRPLASGAMSVSEGVTLAAVLIVGGLAAAAYVSWLVGAILLAYFVLTLTYSKVLKRVIVIDAITLASLYTMRVLAGAAAIEVVPSMWLLAFSTFIFFSLALIKRFTENLMVMADSQRLATRRKGLQSQRHAVPSRRWASPAATSGGARDRALSGLPECDFPVSQADGFMGDVSPAPLLGQPAVDQNRAPRDAR